MTIIEKTYDRAATALGIELTYPKPVADTIKRRDAAIDLSTVTPRNAADELAAAPNPRQWPSILDEIAAHNARQQQAQIAIRGGLVSKANAQIDRALTTHVADYTDQAHDTVAGVLTALTDAAHRCLTLDAQQAVRVGYGDALTELHKHSVTLRAHTAIGSETAPAEKIAQASRALAMIVDPGTVNPIKRTEPSRYTMGGENRSSDADVTRRDATRTLMTDWHRDPTDTLRKLARNQFAGFELSAATSKDYADRLTQFTNAEKVIRVTD